MGGDPEAEELLRIQRERERIERRAAEESSQEPDVRRHERRSDKARYLREKLQERVESEPPAEDP